VDQNTHTARKLPYTHEKDEQNKGKKSEFANEILIMAD
jgi:hypothetical protein